ncbi:hypothetical protein K1T71_009129 [Dendrolimus kikuchii]|uniref:Uncharacterized protein n=1 Tax=Dendrolimus kikuchii TaxID=765133 RepID=A0ACC1CTV8_9NEOP|nr:hypothetical protein K1T71_009129 [Dendrolimus kikuchii]
MKYLCIVILIIIEVSWCGGQSNTIHSSYINNTENKNDIWIWGQSDTKVDNRNNEDSTTRTSAVPTPDPRLNDRGNPCDPFVRNKPTFTGRISEIQCQEHIWQLKYSAEKLIHDSRCEAWKIQTSQLSLTDRENAPEVVGGRVTFPGEFPHMGAIGWKSVQNDWKFNCGGSLISHNFVVTAAHCTSASAADTSLADTVPKIVRFMAKNVAGPVANDVSISEIIVHPNYKSPKKYYDIALIKLEKYVVFNNLAQPACLWTKPDLKELGSATVTGWGVLRPNSLAFSAELQAAELDVLEDSVCNNLLTKYCNRNWCGFSDHQFCAGKLTGGVDACQGDSGGPLQAKIPLPDYVSYNIYNVFGVTSFGVGCAEPGLPGIYTRISSFLDWIEPIVWP